MKIDLHVHTSDRSDCGKSSEEEMIAAAKAVGLDALAFADHRRLAPPERLKFLNEKHAPFRIFGGIEIALGDEHVVVLGVRQDVLEREDWSYDRLHRFVERSGGFLFLAHPYRYREAVGIDMAGLPPDAVEVNSVNMGACDEAVLRRLLEDFGLPGLANSDAHRADFVGVYHNVLERPAADEAELVEILKAGEFSCRRMEERIAFLNGLGGKFLR